MVGLVAALGGCRDEQAGPRPRAQPAQGGQPPGAGGPAAAAAPPQEARFLDKAPDDLTFRSGATWGGGAVAYLGAKVEPKNPTAGQPVRITHYFTARAQPPQGWSFFVHVVDADSGQQLGNLDHEIQGGAAPLHTWPLGKVVEDTHGLQMPNYPGTLRLALGFWRGDDRLPVDDAAATLGPNRMAGPALGGGAPALPEYRAPKAKVAPAIDGKLDDAAWAAAPAVDLVASFDGRPVQRKTKARVTWDDQFVYVAFDCEDPDVWGTLRQKDDPIYNEEVVEVFFDANGDGRSYNELQVSPHNVQFDASFVARRSDLETAKKWESGMVTAVQVRGTLDDDKDQDQGWSAEMKIPIASLTEVPHVPPQKGDVWRFNLYRLEHHVHAQQIEGEAFSPLFVGDFHHLPRFARLVFE